MTDFSGSADRALDYVAQWAPSLPTPVQITLLHVIRDSLLDADHFHLSGNAPESADAQLQERCSQLVAIGLSCTTLLAHGRVVPVVRQMVEEVRADLVVASKRDTAALPDELIESFALELLRDLALPLLVIPARYRASGLPRRALLAVDGAVVQPPIGGAAVARALLQAGPATLSAVLVAREQPSPETIGWARATLLGSQLGAESAALDVITADDPVAGLLHRSQEADLLLVIARHHGLLGRIFHDSYSAHLLKNTAIPLLVLRA